MSNFRENVLTLTEYNPLELREDAFSEDTARLLKEKYSKQIDIDPPTFLNKHKWKLTNKGWVGRVPLSGGLILELEPKVSIGNLFRMMEYAYRFKFEFLQGLVDCKDLEDFYDRLASILALRILDRARKGFYRDYIRLSEHLPYVKGRLQVSSMFGRQWDPYLLCRFDENTADVADNQIIAWTLYTITRSGLCSSNTLRMVRRAYRELNCITSFRSFGPSECINRLYNRLNQDYQPIHVICRFFLENTGPSHEAGPKQILPFMIDMARLFELFVAEWIRLNLPERWNLRIQDKVALEDGGDTHYKIDLTIADSADGLTKFVLDTKYKQPKLNWNYNDVNQVVAYAVSKGCLEGILVYPETVPPKMPLNIGDRKIRMLDFDISGDLDQSGQAFLDELLEE